MKTYKTITVAFLIAIIALGCGSKDKGANTQTPKTQVSQNQVQDQPSDETTIVPEGNGILHRPEGSLGSRVGSGLAWIVGGSFVFAAAYPIERFATELYAVYRSLPSEGLRLLDFVAARDRLIRISMPAIQWIRPRFMGAAMQSYARRFLIGDLTMANVASKAARSRATMWGGRVLYAVGAAMTVIGVADIVLTPTELADGEMTPQDRFEDLKRSAWSLAEKPTDIELQDQLIRSTIAFLPDVINSLKQEYNIRLTEITILLEKNDVSAQDKQKAQEEFKKFEEGQLKAIAFYENNLKALREIYEAEMNHSIDESGRKKAVEILDKNIEELNKIYAKNDR